MASEVVLPAHAQAAVRLQAIRDWCDKTEAENRATCVEGCALCLAMKARLECVAQVRALLT
jgi:hypothetical protein